MNSHTPHESFIPSTARGRRIRTGTVTPRERMSPLAVEPQRVKIQPPLHERLALPGSIAAAVSMGVLLGPVLGLIGFGWVPVTSFFWMLATYAVLTRLTENGPAVRDRFAAVLFAAAGALVVSLLVLMIGYVLLEGAKLVPSLRPSFLTTDMGTVGPLAPLEDGGILHAVVGTLEQIGIALAITIPLGIATALFLNEIGGRFARLVRTVVEAMTALPSVVAGLFVYAAVIMLLTHQFNGFAASLAISVLMLPIMIRSADVVLRLVPGNLREAGLALGAGQWSVVRRVVLPTVRSGLTTAIILATAHGIGETAPVLLTSGVTSNLNLNPFSGPQVSLPLAALEFIKSPQPDMVTRGFATIAVLMILVLVLFTLARLLGGQQAGQVTERQRRRRAAQSLRDMDRIAEHHALVSTQLAGSATDPTKGATR